MLGRPLCSASVVQTKLLMQLGEVSSGKPMEGGCLERKSLKGDSEGPIPVSLSRGTVVGLAYNELGGHLDMYMSLKTQDLLGRQMLSHSRSGVVCSQVKVKCIILN